MLPASSCNDVSGEIVASGWFPVAIEGHVDYLAGNPEGERTQQFP